MFFLESMNHVRIAGSHWRLKRLKMSLPHGELATVVDDESVSVSSATSLSKAFMFGTSGSKWLMHTRRIEESLLENDVLYSPLYFN
jgi:hypothetical protein